MKQSWTRLANIMKRGGHFRFAQPRFLNLFMKHHRNACEIVIDEKGVPLAAVYFTPNGKSREELKKFMVLIRQRVLYSRELEEEL